LSPNSRLNLPELDVEHVVEHRHGGCDHLAAQLKLIAGLILHSKRFQW
jgi:hypothetical protein